MEKLKNWKTTKIGDTLLFKNVSPDKFEWFGVVTFVNEKGTKIKATIDFIEKSEISRSHLDDEPFNTNWFLDRKNIWEAYKTTKQEYKKLQLNLVVNKI